jgi:hypothetical protein
MNIDKTGIRLLRGQIETALAELGAKHNLAISVGSASYLPGKNVTFKLECAAIGADGEVATAEAEAFKTYAGLFGLKADDLGRSFVSQGKKWTIVGCAPRSRKFPILCEDSNGKVFKLSSSSVSIGLGR